MNTRQERWGSRIGLILAMAGNAVGLGNFLRFPVQAVQNGGGAFIIPYLVCFVLMGIPLLWIEWTIGRYGGQRGFHSTPFIMQSLDPKRAMWKYIGVIGVFSNVAVASYYCYIESWTLAYVWHSLAGSFDGLSQDAVANFFGQYVDLDTSTLGIPYEPVVFYLACLTLNVWILSRGLVGGVEVVAKIGMPLLVLFGIFLAYQGISLTAGEQGAQFDGTVGLNFLWQPKFDSLTNPGVWFAAAGQIFFTLSVGMGAVQCYASYVRPDEDIALNAMSAGWMNEFIEIVLGSAILIPISVGYLGIDRVVELVQSGGLGLGFRTMPFLFEQWGPTLSIVAGVAFFGLLFFAGITSSLAMGMPWIGILKDEFGFSQRRAAWSFGLLIVLLGLPTVFLFQQGVLDEYDYWAGTVALVVFGLAESVLFAWIFGMERGWAELNRGAEMHIPRVYRFILRFVTPAFLGLVFVGTLLNPRGGDWGRAFAQLISGGGWQFDSGSLIGRVGNFALKERIALAQAAGDMSAVDALNRNLVFVNGARLLLALVLCFIGYLVFVAYRRRRSAGEMA